MFNHLVAFHEVPSQLINSNLDKTGMTRSLKSWYNSKTLKIFGTAHPMNTKPCEVIGA